MRKFFKILGITLGIGLVAMGGLVYIGYTIEKQAINFVETKTGEKVIVTEIEEMVLCSSGKIGYMVYTDKNLYPTCVDFFDGAEKGTYKMSED